MISKIFLVLLLGTAFCTEAEVALEFGKFISEFGKKYDSIEETVKRYTIFKDNYRRIQEHNAKNSNYELGVNQFADLTLDEFAAKYLGSRSRKPGVDDPCNLKHVPTESKTELDWREKGVVAPVRNQGSCAGCWAFAVLGAVESLFANKKGLPIVELAPQELIDCARGYGENQGCYGGEVNQGYEYVKDHGASTEKEYPYEARDAKCRKKSETSKITGCVTVPANDNQALLEALNYGPVSVTVKGKNWSFMLYKGGIITDSCGEDDELDHAVILIGAAFDTVKKIPYWIVKNSWGTAWGVKGYVYIKRDTGKGEGVCGIAMETFYPVL